MKFLSIYQTAETGVPPTQEEIAKMGKLIEEMSATGELIATEGCLPSAKGARVRRAGSKMTVIDGPFTESKEIVAGFALLEAKSKEHAIEMTKRFLQVAGDGICELRQVYMPGDLDAELAQEAFKSKDKLREQAASRR